MGRARDAGGACGFFARCRLPVGETAECHSALRAEQVLGVPLAFEPHSLHAGLGNNMETGRMPVLRWLRAGCGFSCVGGIEGLGFICRLVAIAGAVAVHGGDVDHDVSAPEGLHAFGGSFGVVSEGFLI
jgi:hypothetical protein